MKIPERPEGQSFSQIQKEWTSKQTFSENDSDSDSDDDVEDSLRRLVNDGKVYNRKYRIRFDHKIIIAFAKILISSSVIGFSLHQLYDDHGCESVSVYVPLILTVLAFLFGDIQ